MLLFRIRRTISTSIKFSILAAAINTPFASVSAFAATSRVSQSMSTLSRGNLLYKSGSGVFRSSKPVASQYGRSPAYRRIAELHTSFPRTASTITSSVSSTNRRVKPSYDILQSAFLPATLHKPTFLTARTFHIASRQWQEAKPKEEPSDPPREEDASRATGDSANESQQESAKDEQSQQDQDGFKEQDKNKQKKEEPPPPPPHGDKSPWQVFTETLQSEFSASKEWNESTKALGSAAHDFTQNPALQRMRKEAERASGAATSSTSKVLKGTGKAVGQGAAWTWDTLPVKGVRASVSATGRGLEKATRPLRETEAWKSARDVIDDGSSSRYGGWTERDERRRKREIRELEETKKTGRPRRVENMEEDPEYVPTPYLNKYKLISHPPHRAGTNVTLHKDAAWRESWRNFRDSSSIFSRLNTIKSTYSESENPLISTARSISDRVAGFFAENETATVIKAFRAMDPSFQLEPFLQDMREYILPEVLDAYVKGDVEVLRQWLSAAQFQVYSALMRQYTTAGLKSDGRILDIRNVDVLSARLLDPGEVPVFILTARTQEVHVYRNAKSGELAAGMEDRVQQVTYAIGVTRLPEDVGNAETRGWRLIELQKSSRDYM